MTLLAKPYDRRHLLTRVLPAAAAAAVWPLPLRGADSAAELPPVRQITRGHKPHWFAYYDKLQFDPSGRYVLGMEVDFEHRSPRADDRIKVGMVDLQDGDRWTELGQSTAWCWQQGCMLQWRPGSATEILWNDRQGDRYVCHLLDVQTRRRKTLPHPIYAVSPDGRWAVATDFRRLKDTRPGYGYNGLEDPWADVNAPQDSGIWRVDLETGEQELVISLADIARIPWRDRDLSKSKHWFNHLLVNPDGTRFEFLHRFRAPQDRAHTTRMFTANPDGSEIRVLDDNGVTSHFIWRDPQHILAWSRYQTPHAFFLFGDQPQVSVESVLVAGDGHCSYLPGNEWILCDTYPDRPHRNQTVYLYHVATQRRVVLGHFHLPPEYTGEWRCDTHPRFSPDGQYVVIDSPHTGAGRQMHLIDIRAIVG